MLHYLYFLKLNHPARFGSGFVKKFRILTRIRQNYADPSESKFTANREAEKVLGTGRKSIAKLVEHLELKTIPLLRLWKIRVQYLLNKKSKLTYQFVGVASRAVHAGDSGRSCRRVQAVHAGVFYSIMKRGHGCTWRWEELLTPNVFKMFTKILFNVFCCCKNTSLLTVIPQ